jgi:acetyl esterase/lipase
VSIHLRFARGRLRLLLAAFVLASSALGVAGCTGLQLALANTPARFGDYALTRDLAYAPGDSHRLDVYRPHGEGARPIVIFLHGGGWTDGSKSQYRFVAEALTSRGFIAVLPGYRLYPAVHFPEFIEDAAQAVAWTHAHADELGGDPARLFVMGHSAGAHIAAMLSYDERFLRAVGGDKSWLRGFIGLSGPYDFLPLTDRILQDVFAPAERYPQSQPVNFVDGGEPPALLMQGRADDVVMPRNTERLAARVRERGGRVEERYYTDMSHGGVLAALSVYYRKRSDVLDSIDRFIRSSADDGAARASVDAVGRASARQQMPD